MRKVLVPLGARSYPVLVDGGLIDSVGPRCRAHGWAARCAVIADGNVAPRFGHRVITSLKDAGFNPTLITLEPGETSKRLRVVEKCYDALARHRLERKSFIVALGGGVTGDLAGFVAATYLRGVPFVQMPTTLLAQVDSSVGGKVGVNLSAGKNLVGAFLQPRLVLCDLATLSTLPEREYRSGIAEVIKYGIIYDAALFRRLERDMEALLKRDLAVLGPVVARCCAIKADVVGQDETESGLRAILNFGHTIGHAIEAITAYGRYLHGEAISVGQVAAGLLSARQCGLSTTEVERMRALFARAGLPVSIRLTKAQRMRLHAAMRLDKKVKDGEIKFVLARRIGEVAWGQAVKDTDIEAVLDELARNA
ncbi:MAG: 3-dehydroquinate synthase [Verrucomicrobiales bacterium]|nr:3-dehydroquinate synthase [Verrucomicrobiales bacterium]